MKTRIWNSGEMTSDCVMCVMCIMCGRMPETEHGRRLLLP
jgi:hypothetical protein